MPYRSNQNRRMLSDRDQDRGQKPGERVPRMPMARPPVMPPDGPMGLGPNDLGPSGLGQPPVPPPRMTGPVPPGMGVPPPGMTGHVPPGMGVPPPGMASQSSRQLDPRERQRMAQVMAMMQQQGAFG